MTGKKQSDKWYKSARWQKLRKAHLAKHPYCQCPHHDGRKLRVDHPAYGGPVVDHNPRHNENPRIFWDPKVLRSMTKSCHDRFRQSEERGGAGFLKGCDERGNPLSGTHHWYG